MGGLSSFLFGDAPKVKSKQYDLISDVQRGGLDALLARLGGARATPYAGEFTAPLSQGEQTSLAAIEQMALNFASPEGQQNFGAAGNTLRALMDFEGQTADTNAFFESNIRDPLLEQFSREILPQISRSFGGSDFFSSERQGAEGLAREDLLESLVAGKERVALDAFNRSRDRALIAAGQVPGLEGAQDSRARAQIDILEAAGLPRQIKQAGLDKEYEDFLRMITQDENIMKLIAQLVLTPTKENTTVVKPGSSGLIPTFLGSFAQSAGQAIGQDASPLAGFGKFFGSLFGGGSSGG